MSLTTNLAVRLSADHRATNPLGAAKFEPLITGLLQTVNGTGAAQADELYAAERTISDGANDDIDLAGGLTDIYGNTITLAEMVALFVVNAPKTGAANTTDLTIGAAATNPFEGFLGGTAPTIGPIKPGGLVLIGAADAAGIGTVVADSADVLRIANSAGAAATYQLGVIGRSA